MTLEDTRENTTSFAAYIVHWRVVESATGTWSCLPRRERKKLVRDLLDHVKADEECESRFFLLRTAKGKMADKELLTLAMTEGLDSQHIVFAVVAIYLALYYSKITGTFDIANFAPQYKQANNF